MTGPTPQSSQSSPLPDRLAARGVHYGWVVVAVTFLTMMVAASAVGAPGVLIGPLQREYGWTVADISAAFAVRFLLFGAVGPFAPRSLIALASSVSASSRSFLSLQASLAPSP